MTSLLERKFSFFILIAMLIVVQSLSAQQNVDEISSSMKKYIRENHLDRIEDMIHKLATSKPFLDQFIVEEERHKIDVSKIKRKDVKIGEDVDIYIKHFTEHQSFTMIMVPISIYSLAIYDTLLFSIIEVTDTWLEREFPYENFKIDSIKSTVLSLKNHDLLAQHLYDQTLQEVNYNIGQFKINLQESYISTNSVNEHMGEMTNEEKELIRHNWGILKKAFSHNVDLNVELNIYVFGFNDLEVLCKNKKGEFTHKITPSNIFVRHHFEEE